ncbi:Neur-chan-LBD domain-containing protein [Aphelenchoides fujianensis]|nr:Neur-chan-LBD domain-containing protein [Aphelenchoides fujianensis]
MGFRLPPVLLVLLIYSLCINAWTVDDYGSGEELLEADAGAEPPVHYRLEAYLMKHYTERSVDVKFRMQLYQIVEVNEPQQSITLNTWIVESWSDDFLYWDPAKFGNITEMFLPHDVFVAS